MRGPELRDDMRRQLDDEYARLAEERLNGHAGPYPSPLVHFSAQPEHFLQWCFVTEYTIN